MWICGLKNHLRSKWLCQQQQNKKKTVRELYWTERMADFRDRRKEGSDESTAASLTSDGSLSHTLGRRREGEKKRPCVRAGKWRNVKHSSRRGLMKMFSRSLVQSQTPERHLKENEHNRYSLLDDNVDQWRTSSRSAYDISPRACFSARRVAVRCTRSSCCVWVQVVGYHAGRPYSRIGKTSAL